MMRNFIKTVGGWHEWYTCVQIKMLPSLIQNLVKFEKNSVMTQSKNKAIHNSDNLQLHRILLKIRVLSMPSQI